jgi:hypothetical protein
VLSESQNSVDLKKGLRLNDILVPVFVKVKEPIQGQKKKKRKERKKN